MGFDDAADDEDASAAVEEPSTPLSFFLGFAASGATEDEALTFFFFSIFASASSAGRGRFIV